MNNILGKTVSKFGIRKNTRKFINSVWVFPVVLFLLVCLLSTLKISGTSIGIYNQDLYGKNARDPNLLFGQPRAIRSDEWLFTTQMIIAQSEENFPHINNNINTGRDMSLNVDVPYRDWSVVFKPQNLVFFILSLEFAFAFKWWIMLYALIVACYFFILRIFPNKRLLSVMLSCSFAFSPFIFWWYQAATIAPLFYGFVIMLLGIRIIDYQKFSFLSAKISRYMQVALLSYILACFALILYPPFQIPVAITVFAFLVGYLLQNQQKYTWSFKTLARKSFILLIPIVISLLIVGVFLATRSAEVAKLQNTVYPGQRIVASGGTNLLTVFSSHLQPQLQVDLRATSYFNNQSEASNFILLLPFLFIPGLFITYLQWKKGHINRIYLSLQIVSVLFLANLFIPKLTRLYHVIGLDKVPHERLLIGLGFVGFLHMLYTVKFLDGIKFTKNTKNAITYYSIACFLIILAIGIYTKHLYPAFIINPWKILVFSLIFSSIVFFILKRKIYIASFILLGFSFICVWQIHPLYRGLGPLVHSPLRNEMKNISKKQDTWVTLDEIIYENIGLISGRDTLSGIQLYPDLDFWRQVEGSNYDFIYNRYAHVLFTGSPTQLNKLQLTQTDSFMVKLECSDFIRKNVEYVLSSGPTNKTCLEKVDFIEFPNKGFYIYKIIKT